MQAEALKDLKEGYLVRYTDGMTGFIYSNPMDWPLSIINQIMCVHKMVKPQRNPNAKSVDSLAKVEEKPMRTN